MADPRAIRTRADLSAALERMFRSDGRSYLVLATVAGVGNSTLHDMVNGQSFPRWETLRAVLAACGVRDGQLDAWKQAHARARADQSGSRELGDRLGRPLEGMTDPFEQQLEIHRAVQVTTGTAAADLAPLPAYVPRAHDRELEAVVARAVAGRSQVVVLVGGSSTGKTRACWEALHLLRGQPRGWRLWHPIDPSRPEAVLAGLPRIEPRTVLWLNEAQFYLADPVLGERVAAGLRELLRDPSRGPVLVLATLWSADWDTLITRTEPDRHAQARELLAGRDIPVPDTFTGPDLIELRRQAGGDPRLAEAAEHATDGQITQYLAGGPMLLGRYRHAPPAAKALVEAAMDARRLGCGPYLPLDLLAGAARGYLSRAQREQAGHDWLRQALSYATTRCNGIPGILIPYTPSVAHNWQVSPVGQQFQPPGPFGPLFRLADYLDQYGRRRRADLIPPNHFWTAATAHAFPFDWTSLGFAAWHRGLYRHAIQLHKNAAACGDPYAAIGLVRHGDKLSFGDRRPAQWAAMHTSLEDPGAVAELLEALQEASAPGQIVVVLARNPAAHVRLDDPWDVGLLLSVLRRMGAGGQVRLLLARDPAAHVRLGHPMGMTLLLDVLRDVGAGGQVRKLMARKAAARATVDPRQVHALLNELKEAGVDEQLTELIVKITGLASLDDPANMAMLLEALRAQAAGDYLEMPDPTFDNLQPSAIAASLKEQIFAAEADKLIIGVDETGVDDYLRALRRQDPATRIPFDDPEGLADLLGALDYVYEYDLTQALLDRDPAAHIPLTDPEAVACLLRTFKDMRANKQARELATRAARHIALDDPDAVAHLIAGLARIKAHEQLKMLLTRDPATHACLDDPRAVAHLLESLQDVGVNDRLRMSLARDQLQVLLARNPAAHVRLNEVSAVEPLLAALTGVGAADQVTTLVDRLPAAGKFEQFIEIGDNWERFEFGREPDGSPAAPWRLTDLR
ncbi:hypothetical protein [Acrocarpospora catenulata]|uniref:hypothetical protein n=1 Tax=Acrocarpospora catenulata TaxID=2836182 RepID=UPI001BD9E00D|nr:hypothetical protein [Acrocarpospora catenulata]